MKNAIIQGASPLVAGNYDFTDATSAAPNNDFVGALFWEGISTNANNTPSFRFSFGACDSFGNNLSLGFGAQDATVGALGESTLSIVNCLSMPNATGSVTAPIAAWSSNLSNGVRLNLSTAPGTARITDCALLSGADVEMECGNVQFVAGDTNKTITFAHLSGKADILILLTSSEQTGGDTVGAGGSIGWYERTGGAMASSTFRLVSGANPTDIIGYCSSASTGEILSNAAVLADQTVDTFSSTGFRIHLSANPGVASLVGWIAIRGKSQQINTKVLVASLPTATGNTALVTGMVAPGPTCVMSMPGRFTVKDTIERNDQAGHMGMCIAATPDRSATTQASATGTFQSGVASSVGHNKNTLNRFMSTQADDGTDVIVGTVNSWDSGASAGITVNYTAVNASTIFAPVLAFGMPQSYSTGPYTYTGEAVTFSASATGNVTLMAGSGTYDYVLSPSSSDVEMGADFTTYHYTGSTAFLVYTPTSVSLTASTGLYSLDARTATLVAIIPFPPTAPPIVYPFNPLVWTADNPLINASGSPGQWTNTQQEPFHPCTADGWWGGVNGVNSIYPRNIGVPPALGKNVTTRSFSWAEMARRAWGSEFSAPDHRVYEWSNGRGFDSTDRGSTGIYRDP